MRCGSCGADNPPDSKFCMTCGNMLGAPAPSPAAPDDGPAGTTSDGPQPSAVDAPAGGDQPDQAGPVEPGDTGIPAPAGPASGYSPPPGVDPPTSERGSEDDAAGADGDDRPDEPATAGDARDPSMTVMSSPAAPPPGAPAPPPGTPPPPPGAVGGPPPPAGGPPGWGAPPPPPGPGPSVAPPPAAAPAPGAPGAPPGAWGQPAPPPGAWGQPAAPPGAWGQPAAPPGAWGQPPPPPGAWGTPGSPPSPGWPAPGAPPGLAQGPTDPTGIGVAAGRLGNGPRKQGRTSLLITAALLDDGERVMNLVQGQFKGANATLVLTGRRLLLVNDREWLPEVTSIDISGDLAVQGLQDGRSASMQFQVGGTSFIVDRIVDVQLAQEMAAAVRGRVAAHAAGGPPEA